MAQHVEELEAQTSDANARWIPLNFEMLLIRPPLPLPLFPPLLPPEEPSDRGDTL